MLCNKVPASKLFRPWDSSRVAEAQDSTISTTTEDEAINHNGVEVKDPATIPSKETETKNKKVSSELPTRPASSDIPYVLNPMDPYYPWYPAVGMANSLGLSPQEYLLLEEEYARILNQEHQAKLLTGRKQRPKKYRCPHCDVGFSNNGQLKGHIRIHTGERPYRCEEKNCGKTFTRNEELTRHKRIHSGLRPFPCAHCGKRFGRKDHLKKHSRTHLQPRGICLPALLMSYDPVVATAPLAWSNPEASYHHHQIASSSYFPPYPAYGSA